MSITCFATPKKARIMSMSPMPVTLQVAFGFALLFLTLEACLCELSFTTSKRVFLGNFGFVLSFGVGSFCKCFSYAFYRTQGFQAARSRQLGMFCPVFLVLVVCVYDLLVRCLPKQPHHSPSPPPLPSSRTQIRFFGFRFSGTACISSPGIRYSGSLSSVGKIPTRPKSQSHNIETVSLHPYTSLI